MILLLTAFQDSSNLAPKLVESLFPPRNQNLEADVLDRDPKAKFSSHICSYQLRGEKCDALGRRFTMKHLLLLAVLIYVTGGQGYCGQASDLRELTQLVDDINAAVVKADMTFLERVLHKDYVHYGQHGLIENRSQYLKNRKTGHVDYESLVANDVKVRVYGDTAIVTYLSTAKGKDPLGAIDDQRLFTRVFVRRDGRWQQVHSQATPIRLAAAWSSQSGGR